MKTPDKIYISEMHHGWYETNEDGDKIQYIRKDVLFERMKERRQYEMENGEEGTLYRCGYADGRVNMLDDLIEDFNSL